MINPKENENLISLFHVTQYEFLIGGLSQNKNMDIIKINWLVQRIHVLYALITQMFKCHPDESSC